MSVRINEYEGLIRIQIKGVSLTIITFYHLDEATSPKSRFFVLIDGPHISSNSQVISQYRVRL